MLEHLIANSESPVAIFVQQRDMTPAYRTEGQNSGLNT